MPGLSARGVERSEFLRIENRSLEHVGLRYFRLHDAVADALARHPRLHRIDVDAGPLDGLRALADARLPSVAILCVLGRRGPLEELVRSADGSWTQRGAS